MVMVCKGHGQEDGFPVLAACSVDMLLLWHRAPGPRQKPCGTNGIKEHDSPFTQSKVTHQTPAELVFDHASFLPGMSNKPWCDVASPDWLAEPCPCCRDD
ncbi:hypothetical protein AALO_G00087380 [Alosa alosa]|uniref:Uncharacterized protein n=1 Tax=Alosa alosa TaxID=278164 RepID=A0AAV6GZ06_9TELE|nr:hypothetical protein AALO_G00087380 [Alosa alosa]